MYEKTIQRDVVAYLEIDGWYVIKLIQTTKNGIPDLLCLKNGITMFIEVKRPNGVLSDLQKYRLHQLSDMNFHCFVISNLNQLTHAITDISTKLPEKWPFDYFD
jgi:hypothetical protein